MKKALLLSTLALSTTLLFSFKPADVAEQESVNLENYVIHHVPSQEFLGLYQEYRNNGNELLAIPTCNLLRAGVRYAKAVWSGTGRNAFWNFVNEVTNAMPPWIVVTEEDVATAEEIGLMSAL